MTNGLNNALAQLIRDPSSAQQELVEKMSVDPATAERLVRDIAPQWLADLSGRRNAHRHSDLEGPGG